MTTASKSRGRQPVFDIIWPYAAFVLLVAVYSALTLGHGFNATDEGYLLSLGQRVVDGQRPYTDFYFFRTPMSVYIQAVRIEIFGDSYTILMSRILWTFQMCIVAILISIVYR
ncbi:MAG: hypothetical protein JSW34_02130, partial [Candidatus Zixiibacteriota bacterium]